MDENAGSTDSLRNLPTGRLNSIRQMFETSKSESQNESNTVSTSSPNKPTAAHDGAALQLKPLLRVKPKLSDLPAKPKTYAVPIHKSALSANGDNTITELNNKPHISPKTTSAFKGQTGNGQSAAKAPIISSPRCVSKEPECSVNSPASSNISAELEVRLRSRTDRHAVRLNCHRKSEPEFNASSTSKKPVPSPKRFSGNFDKTCTGGTPVKPMEQKTHPSNVSTVIDARPSRTKSDNEDPTYGKIDILKKAKIFEEKKTPPERPAMPKFKPGHIRQKSAGSVVEYTQVIKTPKKTQPVSMVIAKKEETENPEPVPPSKPPRTHAHDQYLQTKIQNNEMVYMENELYQSLDDEVYVPSVSIKDRVSQFHQRPLSHDDAQRAHPPSRPPPPQKRNSSDSKLPSASSSVAKETWMFTKEAPEIPDSAPPLEVYESALPFKSYGTLPRKHKNASRRHRPNSDESDNSSVESPRKFLLRKSLSSECLRIMGKKNEHYYEDPSELRRREEDYEAYVDTEGYAVPNKFIKRKVRDKMSYDPELVQDRRFSEALKAKFDDIRKKIVPDSKSSSSSSSQASEDPMKVNNKKCRNLVRERINLAFSILGRYVRKKSDSANTDIPDTLESDTLSNDSESFVDVQEILKRKTYASTMRNKTYSSIKASSQFIDKIYPQLFEYAVIVGLRPVPAAQGYEAYIIHKFPEIVDSNVSVPLFCFPDATDFKVEKNFKSETYSFVLTNFDGGRVYGYCKRLQLPNSNLPEVVCIISPVEADNMYNTLLNEIERKRMQSLELAQELLAASFGRPLPKPGHDVQIRSLDIEGELETIHLHRPSDARLENVHYECLLTYLGTDKMIKVFSSLLLERRVILCSNSLSTLTHVIHAAVALLYPFHWQHIYIPILPEAMLDVCCSPTPYLIGILRSHLSQVLEKPLEEVLIVDLDKKSIIHGVGDESTLLPKKITKALKTAINMCKIDIEAEKSQALMISEAFLRVFVETVGHYGEFITTQQDNKRVFLKENFISKVEYHGVQQFLEWFTETQMFEVFITNHLEKRDWGTVDVFMTRIMEYKEGYLPQVEKPGLGMKVKNFGKVIKSKLS